MRGFPKTLSSKEDYLYVKDNFSVEEWKPEWQKLLDNHQVWMPTGEVASEAAGVTDATHKVEKMEEDGKVTFMQYELQDNPEAKIYRLGFTVAEVEAALR